MIICQPLHLVGFQTRLKFKEQERVFRKSGLAHAEFVRFESCTGTLLKSLD